jgi:YfiH family protein
MSSIQWITPNWDVGGVRAGFSLGSRVGAGVEESDMGINTLTELDVTDRNRRRFVSELGLNPERLSIVRQVHGSDVLYAARSGILGDADGIVTDISGLSLGILVADCAVVLICDPKARVVGALHAGWRGAIGGIVQHGLEMMRSLKGSDFYVWMSPCIGVGAFEVGEEVAGLFPEQYVVRKGFTKPHVDLKSFLTNQLQDNGVKLDHIFTETHCTFESDDCFSYRRQGKASGRMMGVVGLV